MVSSTLKFFGVSLFLAGSALADLQLAPATDEYEVDGIKFRRLAFQDSGNKKVTYTPPSGWDSAGTGARLTLRPRNKTQAEASVTKVPLLQPVVFDEETTTKLAAEALAALPSGSTAAAIVAQEKNPIVFDEKETFLVTISYDFQGQQFARSIMFLNRGAEQLRFQLASRLVDFEELHRAFLGSHFSWRNL